MTTVTEIKGPGRDQLARVLEALKNRKVDVGWFSSAKYEDGTSVAYVASIQEFGVAQRSIPPRPFIRPTITEQEAKWKELTARGARAIAKGNSDTHSVLTQIGGKASGDIRKAISRVVSPPLTLTTLLLRKRKIQGDKITGKTVGEAYRAANFVGPRSKKDKSADVSGVSKKPLVFSKILLNTLTFNVSDGNV